MLEAFESRRADDELFLECEGNPYAGELMGRGLHSELVPAAGASASTFRPTKASRGSA